MVLLIINLAVFAADHVLNLPIMKSLYLYHSAPKYWQFVTAAFCHLNWEHLSSNLFMLMVFGRVMPHSEIPCICPLPKHCHLANAVLLIRCTHACRSWRKRKGALGCG